MPADLHVPGDVAGAAAPWASLVARLVLGLVFVVAGVYKIASPLLALQGVQAYQILPGGLASAWAYGQPGLLIALGVLLLVGLGTRLVSAISVVFLLTVLGAAASAWARGLAIDTAFVSGGGPVATDQTRYPRDLLITAGLLILAAIIVRWSPGRESIDEMLGLVRERKP
jgi:uncharacterized membrane protein YphA (DoxX/SURF4 family)